MPLKLDKSMLEDFAERGIKKIKVYFYDAGCSGTKVDVTDEFVIDNSLELIPFDTGNLNNEGLLVFVEKNDIKKFENCSITRVIKADHTGKAKIRYIYSSDEVKERCGCGTSFNFEKKIPKLNTDKLKSLQKFFKNNKNN